MNRWIDGWMNRQIDGQMDREGEREKEIKSVIQF